MNAIETESKARRERKNVFVENASNKSFHERSKEAVVAYCLEKDNNGTLLSSVSISAHQKMQEEFASLNYPEDEIKLILENCFHTFSRKNITMQYH